MTDAVIIGGGHNGLICAAYLAKAGRTVVVCEARARPGGAATTEEIHPGYHAPACAHILHLMHPKVIADLGLARHGLDYSRRDLATITLLPDGGLRELYDRSFGYQASRGSPFSIWGLEPSLDDLQTLARALPVLLGIAFFFLPARRTSLQIAALGAALLIATQVGATHWFYFSILWWAPFALVSLLGTQRRILPKGEGSESAAVS